jgi:tetratricopeptide (TPR) repeat protein
LQRRCAAHASQPALEKRHQGHPGDEQPGQHEYQWRPERLLEHAAKHCADNHGAVHDRAVGGEGAPAKFRRRVELQDRARGDDKYHVRETGEQELGTAPQEETTQLYEAIKAKAALLPSVDQHPQLLALEVGGERTPALERAARAPRQPHELGAAQQTFLVRQHNLPPQPSPFVGREQELAEIARLLQTPSCSLLTLIGLGGMGKTRLALQVAANMLARFQHGVCFVPCAPVSSPRFLVSTIADALKFSFYGGDDPRSQLINYLRKKELFLVIDNFEQLVEGGELLAEILSSAPEVKLLVTSRERLGLQEEWIFEVQGLVFPEGDQPRASDGYSAVELFLQSARRAHASFALGPEEQPFVVRICQLVDGMPLGIELAAAWVRMLDCREIAQQIEHNRDFLVTSLRNVPERHRSMRAVFAHSWDLLSEQERGASRQIGNTWGLSKSLNNLGLVAYFLREYDAAKRLLRESLASFKAIGDRFGTALCLTNLGIVAYERGEHAEAKQLHQESLVTLKEIGYRLGVGLVLKDLGNVACALGEYQESKAYFQEALKLALDIQAIPLALTSLVGIAAPLIKGEDKQQVVELLVYSLGHPASDQETRDRAESLLAELEAQLPPQLVALSRGRAKTRTLEAIVDTILSENCD